MAERICVVCGLPIGDGEGMTEAGQMVHKPGTHGTCVLTLRRLTAAEGRVAELEKDRDLWKDECASISEELGLPSTIRPAEGEIRRLLDSVRAATARAEAAEAEAVIAKRELALRTDAINRGVERCVAMEARLAAVEREREEVREAVRVLEVDLSLARATAVEECIAFVRGEIGRTCQGEPARVALDVAAHRLRAALLPSREGCIGCRNAAEWGDQCATHGVPVEFWQSRTPSQVRELLKTAPRAAGPWKRDPGDEFWQRVILRPELPHEGSFRAAYVDDVGSWGAARTWDSGDDATGQAASVEEAKTAADAVLRACGWLLCDGDDHG